MQNSMLPTKFNAAPTVILLHGFPGNSNSPYGLAERLEQKRDEYPGF